MADDDSDQDAGKGCLLRVPEMLTQGCLPPGRGDGRGVDARGARFCFVSLDWGICLWQADVKPSR